MNRIVKCPVEQIDLTFVLDSSSSVTANNWGIEKNFVRNFVDGIPSVSQDDAR